MLHVWLTPHFTSNGCAGRLFAQLADMLTLPSDQACEASPVSHCIVQPVTANLNLQAAHDSITPSQAPDTRPPILNPRSSAVSCAGRLFAQLVDMLRFYMAFPIADLRLEPLSDEEVQAQHAQRVQAFQRLLFKHHPPLR